MRLLERGNDVDLQVSDNLITDIPPYVILSHTWGREEVTFQDIENSTGKNKAGYKKLQFLADQARKDSVKHFWADTCCIDKTSSAELTEAINSMFRYYAEAKKCYVYLADVPNALSWRSAFMKSRWITRGWTLQELLAPSKVEFFAANGQRLGTKKSLEKEIAEITGIPSKALRGGHLSDFSIAERMSWRRNRKTTRKEDEAYSLLGIFGVYISVIYGEGPDEAFKRLNDAIEDRAKRIRACKVLTVLDECAGYVANSILGGKEARELEAIGRPPKTYNCNTPLNTVRWSISKYNTIDSIIKRRAKCVRCPKCYWEYPPNKDVYLPPRLACGREVEHEVVWKRFHYTKGNDSAFRCFVCQDGEMRHWRDMKEHLEEEHSWDEIRKKPGPSR